MVSWSLVPQLEVPVQDHLGFLAPVLLLAPRLKLDLKVEERGFVGVELMGIGMDLGNEGRGLCLVGLRSMVMGRVLSVHS